jgi:hypothetical protein
MRFFVGLFLLAWLGAWFAGFSSAVSKLSTLIFWTLVGAFVVYWAYRALRPSVPESLRLMPDSVTDDSGILPFQACTTSRTEFWESMFSNKDAHRV